MEEVRKGGSKREKEKRRKEGSEEGGSEKWRRRGSEEGRCGVREEW